MSDCGTGGKNLGSQCNRQRGRHIGFMYNETEQSVALTDLLLDTDVRALFQTGGWHIFTGELNEVTQPSNIEQTLDGGSTLKIGVNSPSWIVRSQKVSDSMIKAVESWDGKEVYGFAVYANEFLQGKSFDDVNLVPIVFNVTSGSQYATAADAEMTILKFMMAEGEQVSLSKNVKTFDISEANYDLRSLKKFELKDVVVTVTAGATATAQILTVKTLEGVPVTGLVKEEFVFTKGATTVTPSAAVDNGDGTYNTTTSTLAAGTWTAGLVPPSAMTLLGYKNTVLGSFVISA